MCLTGDDDLGEDASKNMPSTGTVAVFKFGTSYRCSDRVPHLTFAMA